MRRPPLERDPTALFRALTQVSHAVSNALSLDQILHLASEQAALLLGVARSLVLLTDDAGGLRIRAHHGLADPTAGTFSGTFDERLISTLAPLLGGSSPDHVLAVPLCVRGHVTGLLAVGPLDAVKPSGPREAMLTALADQVAAPLEIARLAEEVRDVRLLADNAEAATGVGTFDWNLASQRLAWSAEFHHLHGLPISPRPTVEAWLAAVHPDDRAAVGAVIQTFSDSPASLPGAPDYVVENEYRVVLPDGAVRWITLRVRFVSASERHPARLLGVGFDVTERKSAETALRASDERFRLATQALAGFVYDWYLVTNRLQYFGRTEALLGWRVEEVPEDPEWWKSRVHPDDLPRAMKTSRAALDRGDAGWSVEYRVRHRDGHYIDVAEGARIVRNESGGLIRVVGGMTDISKRRNLERERAALLRRERAARAAAEAGARARDDVLGRVSHDLLTALSTIGISASALRQSVEGSSESLRPILQLTERSVAWMDRQIHDLLDVASIEAGRLAIEPRVESPADILAQIGEMFSASARDRGVTLATRAAPDLPVVHVDLERVLQGLANLTTNALKFTDRGGRITVHAERDPRGVRFAVDDTGVGIAPADLPHVFDHYWQKHSRGEKGTGLGLAIVRGIVEAHGGQLGVESTPGQGSRFSFTVPSA